MTPGDPIAINIPTENGVSRYEACHKNRVKKNKKINSLL